MSIAQMRRAKITAFPVVIPMRVTEICTGIARRLNVGLARSESHL